MADEEVYRLARIDGRPLVVRLAPEGAPIDDDRVGDGRQRARRFAGRLWNAVERGHLRLSSSGEGPVALDALRVADFHLVRDLAERRGVIAREPASGLTCRNCDEALAPDPAGAPLEPLLEASEDDAPPAGPFHLRAPIDGVVALELRPVTIRQARPLFRFAASPRLPLDGRVVRALGVGALHTERRRIRSPEAIARVLARDPDERLFAIVEALYAELNYPPRLRLPCFCARCGAIHELPTPSSREVHDDPSLLEELRAEGAALALAAPENDEDEDDAPIPATFPSLEQFVERAMTLRDEVYAARRVANIELVVDDGVPPVDDGGEPLMGSYEPLYEGDVAGYTEVRFVITLYYRTFASMFEEAPYDVDAEIRDTIDHEVEHHLYHLAGHDPMDEEERREARRDLERTFGRQTVRHAERRALASELREMGRFFLWGLLICAALLGGALALGLIE
ncbi:MAG: metallopeptidase family protein [Myxococcales bacterium]|nr:metallopeptidase family protein [Myxococcales bacterium]